MWPGGPVRQLYSYSVPSPIQYIVLKFQHCVDCIKTSTKHLMYCSLYLGCVRLFRQSKARVILQYLININGQWQEIYALSLFTGSIHRRSRNFATCSTIVCKVVTRLSLATIMPPESKCRHCRPVFGKSLELVGGPKVQISSRIFEIGNEEKCNNKRIRRQKLSQNLKPNIS